ncbi:MAG: DEAD/DEAH box helicase [Chloroflexota bacterium]|nr:DEAD/DEAH box helicase [Chloroflexota bacterium]
MPKFAIGSLVRCREREWIVLPSERDDVLLLRPLGGTEAETCGIYLPLEEHTLAPATFHLPMPESVGDFVSGQLLRDAARLSLRSGAGPFRSLGRLGARPRPYQLVPLIMALRLDPVRLLIADDVGIGKTVEAALIVRELLDRNEIRRMTVLCPPHLCDQWQRELRDKFAIEAEIVRSSTVAALERRMPPQGDVSLFEYYPFTVASIDYVKTERNRPGFVRSCPELVIVDEAHTAARPGGQSASQQQRFDLIREIAAKDERHLLLLTATPHSGIEESFRSLLGLLQPDFEHLDLQRLQDTQREALSRYFVQRRRADVKRWLGEDTPFPEREWTEGTYSLARSPHYRKLFDDVFSFARELVQDGTNGTKAMARRQRVRYWAALALLRCVMSSPAAAQKALEARAGKVATPEMEDLVSDDVFGSYVHDRTEQEASQDVEPTHVVEEGSDQSERTRLRRFASRAAELYGPNDPKLVEAQKHVETLLRAGYNPIVYCRYIATANYIAEELRKRIKGIKELQIVAVTGERSEEEREALVAELSESPRRLLIATDCLSEGINLQHAFDAVLHYDLPWNPNRLEQREGRVDRYGQARPTVRTLLLYGTDNPIDQVVMKVLLKKAVTIHRSLGISVPLPINSETVMETLISSLFHSGPQQLSLFENTQQLSLLDVDEQLDQVDQAWKRAEERERESRTRFAQRAIKPDEVARELQESDAVLGDQVTVRQFVQSACERVGAPLAPVAQHGGSVWRLVPAQLPPVIRERVAPLLQRGRGKPADSLLLTFDGVAAPEVELVGRNHVLTTALSDYLLESALSPLDASVPAARSGVVRTNSVQKRTVLLLLRVRMLIEGAKQRTPVLAEELVVTGFSGRPDARLWLDQRDALDLLHRTQPTAALTTDDREYHLAQALEQVTVLGSTLHDLAADRARQLEVSHNRVRTTVHGGREKDRVQPNLPPDVLGVYVLLPQVGLQS